MADMAERICSIPDCGRLHDAHGLCSMHNIRVRRHGATDPPPSRRRVCVIDGCGKLVTGHGWCSMHYTRWKKHGDPLAKVRFVHPGDAVERFWAKVAKREPDECWEWLAHRLPDGYGQLRADGRLETTHRFSWALHNGPIPNGLWVLHRCDNPPCCNPSHLFLGTSADNVADMVAKGRQHGRNRKAR